MFFPSLSSVRRIEAAEAASLAALVRDRGPETFVHEVAGGLALFRGDGSPLNKVVGAGFAAVDEETLVTLERRYAERGAPVQFEVATHTDPAFTNLLAQRGYHLTGYEDVHAGLIESMSLTECPPDLMVRPARTAEHPALLDVLVTGFSHTLAGEPRAEHDDFGRDVLERVFADMMAHTPPEHWAALRDGRIVGGAAMNVCEGIAFLMGAATHPDARRRGVQRALLSARLADGRARGADLAVVTTQPGSQSQQNVLRAGFALAYTRAIWLRHP